MLFEVVYIDNEWAILKISAFKFRVKLITISDKHINNFDYHTHIISYMYNLD